MLIGGDIVADYNLYPEDICLSIKNLLSNVPILVTENNVTKNVPALYVYPESQLADLEMPSIVLFEIDPIPDPGRRREAGGRILDNQVYTEVTKELVQVDARNYPEPFILYIYIRLKYKYVQHRDIVRKEIYKRFKVPFGGITVNGYALPIFFVGESLYEDSKEVETKEYKLAQWRFKVPTWFDVHERKTLTTARDVTINTP
jgi:hypothetical protein